MILNGADGLTEVAQRDGRWNWVLVGPNPEALPLVGGGAGGVDEMRSCLAKQEAESKAEKQFANFYGLIRMRFGSGRTGRTKYVFVQASRVDEQTEDGEASPQKMSAVKHGQAMSQKGNMEKAFLGFTHFAAKLETTRLEDLSVDNVIEQVQKNSTADADLCTSEAYFASLGEWIKAHPEMVLQVNPEDTTNEKAMTEACAAEIFENELQPSAEAAEAVLDKAEPTAQAGDAMGGAIAAAQAPAAPEGIGGVIAAAQEAPSAPAAQAKPEEPEMNYKRGDLLFVYSNAAKQWMDDGIVVAVLQEGGDHDGLTLPKNALKVQYNNRRQFKWVTPLQLKQYVKPSKRPVPPPTLLGELLKETHNWISQWHVRYFELSKGYLQWWLTSDEAKNGQAPNGSLSLTGLEMTVKDTVMYIRTATSKGMIYAFDATTIESISKWSEMMKQHEEYCRKMQAYLTQRASEVEGKAGGQGQDKFSNFVVERKRRATLNQEQAA